MSVQEFRHGRLSPLRLTERLHALEQLCSLRRHLSFVSPVRVELRSATQVTKHVRLIPDLTLSYHGSTHLDTAHTSIRPQPAQLGNMGLRTIGGRVRVKRVPAVSASQWMCGIPGSWSFLSWLAATLLL